MIWTKGEWTHSYENGTKILCTVYYDSRTEEALHETSSNELYIYCRGKKWYVAQDSNSNMVSSDKVLAGPMKLDAAKVTCLMLGG